MKTCTTCGLTKPFEAFHRDSKKADGYRAQCAACKNEKGRHKYQTDPSERERQIEFSRIRRQQEQHREGYRLRAEEKRRKRGALPLPQYLEWLNAETKRKAEVRREAERIDRAIKAKHEAHVFLWKKAKPGAEWTHRYRNDAEFNAKEKMRARLRKAVADAGLWRHLASELKAGRFNANWPALLGYTMAELVAHLRRTLPKGARWEQFLSGDLHIDHITPRAAFDLTDLDEVRACWSLGNLRLLRAKENQAKGARAEVLL